MRIKKILTLFSLLFFIADAAYAQSLTGTWKGRIAEDEEYLEINIVQVGNKLCGYTGDYVLANPDSYCKAYFTGYYVRSKKQYFLDGTDFIVNSGTHVLMQLLISVKAENGKLTMRGFCRIKPDPGDFAGDPSEIVLHKTSPKPTMMTETMKNCVKDNAITRPKPVIRKPQPVTPKPAPVKPKPVPATPKPAPAHPKPVIRNPQPVTPKPQPVTPKPVPPMQRDTVKVIQVVPAAPVPVMKPLPLKTAGRINKDIRTITIHQKKITLYVYDNAEVDGDSISIYYNGRLLMSHMRLTEKPLKVDLDIDENVALHSLVIFAENLGAIAPNTALIIFTDNKGKRYELFSKADLGVNAELVFKYEPE